VGLPGGGSTQSPKIGDVQTVTIQGLSDKLGDIEDNDTFFVSQLAALLRALCTDLSTLVILSFLLLAVTWWVLWRSSFGLRLRACGESPAAAESLGVHVLRYKFAAVMISGGLAGLAGGVLAMVASSNYRDGQTGGRGYIGLAAMIFGNWRPGGLAIGASLFGYTDALQLRRGSESVHALLILVGALLLALAVWEFRRRNRLVAASSAVLGVLSYVLFFSVDKIPTALVQAAPYITVLVVLALAAQRLRPPAADGKPYRRGG
jgi:simple sugar transport system permease protein